VSCVGDDTTSGIGLAKVMLILEFGETFVRKLGVAFEKMWPVYDKKSLIYLCAK
jgi:hypothetical protein